jgi:hypothetical protein
MPRWLKALARARKVVMPARCISAMTGAKSAFRASTRAFTAVAAAFLVAFVILPAAMVVVIADELSRGGLKLA